MSDKIGSLIIDLQGTTLSSEEKDLLQHPLVGGVIFFARNYTSPEQLISLCNAIRSSRPTPLLIMVDQEGGRVQRFKEKFSLIPPMSSFGEIYAENPQRACEEAKQCGTLLASELLSAGIDISLAPVLDLQNMENAAIGTRAFHSDPDVVIKLATAFMHGMEKAGMAATGKHFPGHGSVKVDSHIALPVDNRDIETIEQSDLIPFVGLIKAGISALMAAHIIYPNIDPLPVSYSSVWLQEILRKRLGFKGIIFSDDLNMEGANISSDYSERVLAARKAGCDFALVCNNRAGVIETLDKIKAKDHMLEINRCKKLFSHLTPEILK